MRKVILGLVAIMVIVGSGIADAANIAVLKDDFPKLVSHSDPDTIAKVLQKSGDKVEFVNSTQLADPKIFNASKFSLVILPYGSYFPANARDNFLAFLRGGGDFLSTGGYAFDDPVIKWQGKWITRRQAKLLVPVKELQIGAPGDQDYLIGEWNMPEKLPTYTKRWSGKMAGVCLPVQNKTTYDLEIELSTNLKTAKLKRQILLNGKLAADIPAIEDQTLKLTVTPAQIGSKTTLDIVFDVELWSPNEIEHNGDGRMLGIAIKRIKLTPRGKSIDSPDILSLLKPINMRYGAPNDFLEWQPEQLGVFDAGYRLTGGKGIVPAHDQGIVSDKYAANGKFEGWAAAGTTGSDWYYTTPSDRSRLIPLLETHDEYGRFRGNAGSLMVNYSGPYMGSVWAYFGLESTDIFAGSKGKDLLLSVINGLKRGVFLHELRPSVACYKQGEPVEILANASNYSTTSCKVTMNSVIKSEAGNVVRRDRKVIELAAGQTTEIKTTWQPKLFGDDFYIVEITLNDGAKVVDQQRTGFYVWNPETIANGMKLSYKNNYLTDNGTPRFMLGVQAFYPWKAVTAMDPLLIERDFASMSDMGMRISRTFTKGADQRYIDSLVMASQRHHVAFFVEGMADANIDPESIKKDTDYTSALIDRYKDVPGMMIDIRNEPTLLRSNNEPGTEKAFIDYLLKQYGTTESLRAAWSNELPAGEEITTVKITMPGSDWSSIRSRDTYRFLLQAGGNWVDAIVKAIKSKDPKRLATVGYLQWWAGMTMDPAVTSDSLDFIDRHWYGPVSDLATWEAQFVMSDRRYKGKAPSLGEFGSKTYPTFAESMHNFDTIDQQEERFLHVGHYALGFGGLFASNWHYRDPSTNIFPYGIVYSDWTPKPVAKSYRAMALLFTKLHPKYVAPDTYLVLPDESRFGGDSGRIFESIQNTANEMINANIRFGTINEWDIEKLPAEAKTLVMPASFAVSDKAYNFLAAWIKNGGTLHLSNDIEFDQNRKPSNARKFKDLSADHVVFYKDPAKMQIKGASYGAGIRVLQVPMEKGEAVVIGNESAKQAQVSVTINNVIHELIVGSHRQATIIYQNGRMVGLEAQGDVLCGDKTIVKAEGHFVIVSLDGADIALSSELAIVALHGGHITVANKALAVQAGEVLSGKWHVLSDLSEDNSKGVSVPASLSGDIIILAAKQRLPAAGTHTAELLSR